MQRVVIALASKRAVFPRPLQTLVKPFIGSIRSGNFVWAKTYPATLFNCLTLCWRYRWMKVLEEELSHIQERIGNGADANEHDCQN